MSYKFTKLTCLLLCIDLVLTYNQNKLFVKSKFILCSVFCYFCCLTSEVISTLIKLYEMMTKKRPFGFIHTYVSEQRNTYSTGSPDLMPDGPFANDTLFQKMMITMILQPLVSIFDPLFINTKLASLF